MEAHCKYLVNMFISQSDKVMATNKGFYDEELLNEILLKHSELVERYAFSVLSNEFRI
jgi:hypothetical protein